jgi:general secretion pathway protein A
MNLDFYKLAEQPFGVTPDPRYLYPSRTHREASEALQHGVSSGRGFTALIANPGMGKTTLLFDLLGKASENATRVFLSQPQLTPKDLLRSVLEKLGIQDDSDEIVIMQRWLNDCLLRESKAGKKVIVVIDEAQSLDEGVLEVVRMLSNFETSREKLLHLVLAGQPALGAMLASPRLVQLRQRISIVARLHPFDPEETRVYIGHRLATAGYDAQSPALFTKRAIKLIAYHSGGIPRNINTLCFNALSLGCASESRSIDGDVIETVVKNLDLYPFYGGPTDPPKTRWRDRFGKRTPPSNSASTLTHRWWLRSALGLLLLGALGGVLTRADWRSLHLPNPFRNDPALVPAPVAPSVPADAPSTTIAPSSGSSIPDSPPTLNPASDRPATAAPVSSPVLEGHSTFVTVKQNQTIFRICIEALGKYDDRILSELRELNPGISDFTRIRVGQQICIPATQSIPKVNRMIAAQQNILRPVKVEKP